ncbi:hypothetical protein [Clostridium sp.]|uniref:hypothetical protein n=1 Tax=Clostridium sp. TaxID=1506 RepID=UPI0034649939
MDKFFQVFALALLVESTWETLKMVWQEGHFCIDKLGVLLIGLLVAFTTGIDIMKIIGINMKFNIGIVFTGIILSRGSNFTHDLLVSLNKGAYRK